MEEFASIEVAGSAGVMDLGSTIEGKFRILFKTAFSYRYAVRQFIENDTVLAEEVAQEPSEHSAVAPELLGKAKRDEFNSAGNAQLIYAIRALGVCLIFTILVRDEISQNIQRLASTIP